jgi:AraC-like DNA-binding protein
MAVTYSNGHVIEPHSHPWGQVIYAASGTMRVIAASALWLVPQGRALWAPPEVTHEIEMHGAVAMRTIYVPPPRAGALATDCHALEVGALLRELILFIVAKGLLKEKASADERLADVFLDQLAASERLIFNLPMPHDGRASAIARRLREEPALARDLEVLARDAGASARTIQRLFLEETGLRFVEWRQRLKLIHAIDALGQGSTVTAAGAEAGYASTSAFIAAFKQHIGHTPLRYRKR